MRFLRGLFARFSKSAEPVDTDGENRRLLDALRELQQDYDVLDSLFNMTSDPDMIDYYAHEYKALGARYAYLLKQARARGISYQPRIKETVMR